METYLQVFVNYKQNNQAKLLPMAKFAYNNTRNTSIAHTSFKPNRGFYAKTSYKEDVHPWFKSKVANIVAKELRELAAICRKNLQYAQKF